MTTFTSSKRSSLGVFPSNMGERILPKSIMDPSVSNARALPPPPPPQAPPPPSERPWQPCYCYCLLLFLNLAHFSCCEEAQQGSNGSGSGCRLPGSDHPEKNLNPVPTVQRTGSTLIIQIGILINLKTLNAKRKVRI